DRCRKIEVRCLAAIIAGRTSRREIRPESSRSRALRLIPSPDLRRSPGCVWTARWFPGSSPGTGELRDEREEKESAPCRRAGPIHHFLFVPTAQRVDTKTAVQYSV